MKEAGITPLPGRFLDFLDPWGNRIEIVGYDSIQFTKAPNVLRGMGLSRLAKNEQAIRELRDKGMASIERSLLLRRNSNLRSRAALLHNVIDDDPCNMTGGMSRAPGLPASGYLDTRHVYLRTLPSCEAGQVLAFCFRAVVGLE
ncbi:MAG: hypothetical protein WAN86_18955 [Hyphomicrobiaceae bacterium]